MLPLSHILIIKRHTAEIKNMVYLNRMEKLFRCGNIPEE